jgi:hypothetical protein
VSRALNELTNATFKITFLDMAFTYITNTQRISKIEFTSNPELCNIAFSDPGPTFSPTVLIFGIPAATASTIGINFYFPSTSLLNIPIQRMLAITTEEAPIRVDGNNYFEAKYGGRVEIS